MFRRKKLQKLQELVKKQKKLQKKLLTYYNLLTASTRFMTTSLSSFMNNLSEVIHRIKCKYEHYHERCETCGIKYKYCNCFLEYQKFKDDLIEYKCLCCDKNYQQKFDEKLKERFLNA